jgi:hypothetical protein
VRRFLWGAALICGVGVAGCGGGTTVINNPASTVTVTKTATTAAPSTTATTTTTSTARTAAFRSPTGNIVCRMTPTDATCGLRDFSYTPPPEPANCNPGWGHVLSVVLAGPGRFTCEDQIPASPDSPVLRYGFEFRDSPFACFSSAAGFVCINLQTRHGFGVSRERYRTF